MPLSIAILSLVISLLSFGVSGLTFFLTRVYKGDLKMTRPSMICFVGQNGSDKPKVYIRTLLYQTSDKGQYIQNMFVKLYLEQTIYDFNIWFYDESKTVRGSGLFVNKTGIVTNHQFLLSNNSIWPATSGEYKLEVYAETVDNSIKKLFVDKLTITNEDSYNINQEQGVWFDWIVDKYVSRYL